MSEIPEEIRKMFPDQPIHKMDIDSNGNLQILSSCAPLADEVQKGKIMTEPTIQELIDEVIEDAKIYGINMNAGGNIYSSLDTSRAALLSRITQMETERDEWHKMGDAMLKYAEHTWKPLADNEPRFIETLRALSLRYPHAVNAEGKEVKE